MNGFHVQHTDYSRLAWRSALGNRKVNQRKLIIMEGCGVICGAASFLSFLRGPLSSYHQWLWKLLIQSSKTNTLNMRRSALEHAFQSLKIAFGTNVLLHLPAPNSYVPTPTEHEYADPPEVVLWRSRVGVTEAQFCSWPVSAITGPTAYNFETTGGCVDQEMRRSGC